MIEGKYCIVRSSTAGIYIGIVCFLDKDVATLKKVRTVYFPNVDATIYWLENFGGELKKTRSSIGTNIGAERSIIYLTGICEVIPATDSAGKDIVPYYV